MTGGAERLCLNICTELEKKEGLKVKIIILKNINDFEIQDNIEYVKTNVHLSLKSKNKIDVKLLQKKIEDFGPDIIHSHLFEAEIISRSIYYPKAKWFSHLHDNMPQLEKFSFLNIFNKTKITNFYEKLYLLKRYKINGGNQFISISEDTNQFANRTISKRFQYHYLLNAINYNKFNIKRVHKTKEKLQLINVGSFQHKKNQQFLIDVLLFLRKEKINAYLSFLGDGLYLNKVKEKSIQLKVAEYVSFNGNVSKVEEYLKKSDIYVHSAYYEPFGLVLLEAMAASLPVISLDGKGNRDIIIEAKNGFMIEEQNVEIFSNKIIALWNDKAKMNEMSVFANAYAKKFDIVNYTEKILKIYKKAINSQ